MACCSAQEKNIVDPKGSILMDQNTVSGKKHDYKIVIIGDSGIGKTCLLQKYISGSYSSTTVSTVAIGFYNKKILHEGEEINCSFWDTAGQEKYNSVTPMYIRGADVCLLAFDLSLKDYLTSIDKWLNVLRDSIELEHVYVVLVGTKCDLVNESMTTIGLVETLHPYNCYATSALNNSGVEAPFKDFLSLILKTLLIK